jgi:hypothetical protein
MWFEDKERGRILEQGYATDACSVVLRKRIWEAGSKQRLISVGPDNFLVCFTKSPISPKRE